MHVNIIYRITGAIIVEWGYICDQFGFSSMFGPLITVNVNRMTSLIIEWIRYHILRSLLLLFLWLLPQPQEYVTNCPHFGHIFCRITPPYGELEKCWCSHFYSLTCFTSVPHFNAGLQDLASLMRKGRTFLTPGANSCTDCEPHKMMTQICNEWVLFIAHTHLHLVLSLSLSFLTHNVSRSPKSETNFWKECIKEKKWKTVVPPKFYP